MLLFPITRLVLASAFLAAALILRDVAVNGFGLEAPALRALVTLLVVHAAYVLYVRLVERRPVIELAPRPAARELAVGWALGFGLVGVVTGLLWLLGMLEVAAGAGIAALAVATILVVATAYTEEIVIRGVGFRLLEEALGTWTALGLTALLFGALHLGNENATIASGLAIAATAGVLLAGVYVLTRRLWLAVGIHFAVNWTQGALLGLPVSGEGRTGLFASRLEGPQLLTGGDFGIEASLLTVALGAAAGVEVLRRAHRRGRFVAPLWRRRRDLRRGGIFLDRQGSGPVEAGATTPSEG